MILDKISGQGGGGLRCRGTLDDWVEGGGGGEIWVERLVDYGILQSTEY